MTAGLHSVHAPSICASIDLIVPIYRNPELTRRCLDSIVVNIGELAHRNPRIILVNDSPDDADTSALLKGYATSDAQRVVLITNPVNLGFVRSVNRGLAVSLEDKRDVILINSDTETFAHTLENMIKVANLDAQIAFVSPRSNNASICSLPHFYGGYVPAPQEAYANWASVAHLLPEFHFTPTAVGFYLLIKYAVLANFGTLREDFGIGYEEENDLILRANKAGFRSALANHAFAFHAGSASFGLLDLDLRSHQDANLQKMRSLHAEFIPLVERYQSSPHFRAERMLGELVGVKHRSPKVVFELTGLGCYLNGTSEFALAVIKSFHARHRSTFDITVLCSAEVFAFHGLDALVTLRRENEAGTGTYAIAIKLSQPFDLHQIDIMEDLAPINLYAMLDTLAEDCGYLSVTWQLDLLWRHVATYANGIIYISKFSQKMFTSRFPESARVPSLARLLPTRLGSYPSKTPSEHGRYILILGNHFAHKNSDATARTLSARFPRVRFVVLGSRTFDVDNLQSYRSGTLTADKVELLFTQASIVILPSYVEGFGFGLMHALSRRKVVFAREIEATLEVLSTYKDRSGVHLYQDDTELVELVGSATQEASSSVDDSEADGWEEWADDLARFCKSAIQPPDVFYRNRDRMRQSDLLRRAFASEAQAVAPTAPSRPGPAFADRKRSDAAAHLSAVVAGEDLTLTGLLATEGSQFVKLAYATVLKRSPDAAGEAYYLSRLNGGVGKLQIIQELAASDEAKAVGAVVPGLEEALASHRRRTLFGWGAYLRRLRPARRASGPQ